MPRKLKLSFLNLTVTCGMWVFKIIYSFLIYASYYKYIKEIENTKMKIIKLKEEIEYQHTHPNSEFSLIGYWYAKGYSDEEIEKKIEDLISR